MELRIIGKVDGMPLFELEEGKYIAVDTEKGRHIEMWSWYGKLGRYFDTFEKCDTAEDEDEALEIIRNNLSVIVKNLNELAENADDDVGKVYLAEQKQFYDGLETDREFDWYNGKYSDEE